MTVVARAVVLEVAGRPAVVRELEVIEPRAGEVRVRMLASGVCHSDLHVRDGSGIDRPRSSWATRERGSSSPSARA